MNKFALTLAASLLASGAYAQSAGDFAWRGTIGYQYYQDDGSAVQNQTELALGLSFGQIVGQLDLSTWEYNSGGAYSGKGIHLGYQFNDSLTVGAFYQSDDWGTEYTNRGIEAVYSFDAGASALPVRLEGYAARYEQSGPSTYEFDTLALDASVNFASGFNAGLGYMQTSGSEEAGITTLKVGYDYKGLSVTAEVGRATGAAGDYVGIGLSYSFGGKPTFGPRKWVDVFPTG